MVGGSPAFTDSTEAGKFGADSADVDDDCRLDMVGMAVWGWTGWITVLVAMMMFE